jgi:Cytochrome P450
MYCAKDAMCCSAAQCISLCLDAQYVGHLQMKAGMHVALPEYAKEFGPICKIFFGRYPIVLISDPELVKEVHHTLWRQM